MVMQMKKEYRILAISAIALMLLTAFASVPLNSPGVVRAEPNALLTGSIYDHGEDTDSDGAYNFLIVEVEVNVVASGTYIVRIDGLMDFSHGYYYFNSVNTTYLDVGLQNVSLALNGILIYGYRLNVYSVFNVMLFDYGYVELDYRNEIPLSTTYNYALFDNGASLTGVVFDEGIDTDGDGSFNFLQIGVEVNVSDAAGYEIYINSLINGSDYYYIYVSNSTQGYLTPGLQVLNVSLYGAQIRASHATGISALGWTYLNVVEGYSHQLDYRSYIPMNNMYSYIQFQTYAYFTGAIHDEGIDADGDFKYDYLLVSAEINITEAGNYAVQLESLVDNFGNYLYNYQSTSGVFEVGLHWVNVTIYGPSIYAEHFNPEYIGRMNLVRTQDWYALDTLMNVPLSKQYYYADFESHATLTGNISDVGVDSDGDGLFDYLRVGVEISVTEAGTYQVFAQGLIEQFVNSSRQIYEYQSLQGDFDVGPHTVYFNFSGSTLTYMHFNPTNIADLYLFESGPVYLRLGFIQSAQLPILYEYTKFNAPLNDMQANFTVYPDGTVAVSGESNYTHMFSKNLGPFVNSTVAFSTYGNSTTGSANGTVVMPVNTWPFNSTTAYVLSQTEEGLLNASMGATVFMPPQGSMIYPTNSSDFSLGSTYSNGLLNIDLTGETKIPSYALTSMFPFNQSDVTVLANYVGNKIEGNATFHSLPGFPLSDAIVFFSGNKTSLQLGGNLTLIYGNYFGNEINTTVLEDMLSQINSTYPGQGPGSLYNSTNGMLECTELNTLRVPLMSDGTEYGSTVGYSATIQGNFTSVIAEILSHMLYPYSAEQAYPYIYVALESAMSSVQEGSLELVYYHTFGTASLDLHLVSAVWALWNKAAELVPPIAPPEYTTLVEAWLKIANATAYGIKAFSFNASYSSTTQKLDLGAWILANNTQLEEEMKTILPDAYPPEMHDIVQAYLNTTYVTLKYSNATFNYAGGAGNFEMNWVLQGDFKAEVNHAKQFYINLINATSMGMPMPWQFIMLNETEIDVNNFRADYRTGTDWMILSFNGLVVHPPKDELDFARFMHSRIFNMTAGYGEPPREFERLKMTIVGGSNATHTVLLYAPGTVPNADSVSLNYTIMNWQNTTMSSLKYLQFLIAYQGIANYAGKTYYVPIFTNSSISNFSFDQGAKSIGFTVSGTSGTGFFNATIPRKLLYANLTDWTVLLDGNPLNLGEFNVTENAEYVFLYLNYSHSSHEIVLKGTIVVVEFQPNMLPVALLILSLVATAIAVKERRRLNLLRTRYQNAVYAFVSKLNHQLA